MMASPLQHADAIGLSMPVIGEHEMTADLDPMVLAAVRFSVDRAVAQRGLAPPRLTGTGWSALVGYWSEAVEAVGEDLSLLVASDIPLGALGVASVDTMSAATLRDALDALGGTHLGRLVPGMRLLIVPGGPQRVEIRLMGSGPAALMALFEELVLAIVHRHLSLLTRPVRVLDVDLRRESPVDAVAPWRLFYGVTPRFGRPHTSMHLEAESLGVPLRTANADVQAMVRTVVAPVTTAGRVRAYISSHLLEPCELVDIAAVLETSPRQLQRNLQDEGTSLRELACLVRIEAAEQLLSHSSQPITEISNAVGFAYPASFTRAFVATRHETPLAYRRRTRKTR